MKVGKAGFLSTIEAVQHKNHRIMTMIDAAL